MPRRALDAESRSPRKELGFAAAATAAAAAGRARGGGATEPGPSAPETARAPHRPRAETRIAHASKPLARV